MAARVYPLPRRAIVVGNVDDKTARGYNPLLPGLAHRNRDFEVNATRRLATLIQVRLEAHAHERQVLGCFAIHMLGLESPDAADSRGEAKRLVGAATFRAIRGPLSGHFEKNRRAICLADLL